MKLYMAVTADQYELPLCVEETATVLAKKLGLTLNAVCTLCAPSKQSKPGNRRGYRVVRVHLDDELQNGKK